jgi:hypothetical protein
MTGSRRWLAYALTSLALVVPLSTIGFMSGVGAAPAAAQTAPETSGPACTFNGSTLPIVTGVTKGGTVTVDCTGLPDSTPFLLFETSLVIALDPQTAGLLSGTISPSLLLSVLSASPMLNPLSFSFPTSDSSGNLSYTYTTPTSEPLDSNASCPPSRVEYNSGLIGCAIALVDLTTADEVGAGSAVLEYKGFKFFPPNPTLALNKKSAKPGQVVKVSDASNASTYWWLATLATLEGDLGGTVGGTTTVSFSKGPANATNTITVTPASYNGSTFSPPVIAGGFTVPTMSPGYHTVTVTYLAPLEGLSIGISATAKLYIGS